MSAEFPRRILVVDDNPATLYATARVLRASGFDVLEGTTGTEAIAKATAAEPDLIVLDVNLPDIDGFEVVRRIRAEPRVARVPIVHLSATFVQDAHKVQGLDAGADGYLTHPVEPPVLIASINAFLRARRAEEAMCRSEARFKAVFEHAPDGIALLTREMIFLDANPALCTILARTREELTGKHASALSPKGQENEAVRAAGAVARDGAWRGSLPLLRSDGQRVELDWRLSTHTEPDVLLAIVTDITERKAAEAEREELLRRESAARGDAERANRLKDEFLATLSHELRSPLNAIVGWTHILRRGASMGGVPAEELANALTVIERNARLQTQLVADLLDVSRITSGQMRLDMLAVDPAGPLDAAVEGVRPAAAARSIRLELQLDHDAGPVWADPARLQQVFWNLVSNAVKFTPRDGTVWVRLRRAGSQVEVTVRDNGCGIRADFVPYVFDRFRQEQTSPRRDYAGLGLGLAIVRHLVEMHGGSVAAQSDGEGQGATFTVRLPVSAVRHAPGAEPASAEPAGRPGAPPAPARATPQSLDLRGVRVLVVDDDADSRDLLRRALALQDAEVRCVASAAEAVQAVGAFGPHVLVSDIGMPGEDGYSLMRRLRAAGVPPEELRAIAVTAFARADEREQALAAGYERHLAKPVDVDELAAAVASLARRGQLNA